MAPCLYDARVLGSWPITEIRIEPSVIIVFIVAAFTNPKVPLTVLIKPPPRKETNRYPIMRTQLHVTLLIESNVEFVPVLTGAYIRK